MFDIRNTLLNNWKLVLGVVMIILVIWQLFIIHTRFVENFMTGMWTADAGFCEDADISSMLFYIGEPVKTWTGKIKRECYLIINDNIYNGYINVSYYRPFTSPLWVTSDYMLDCELDFDEEESEPFPNHVQLKINVTDGILKIIDPDEKIYLGFLYKNHELSL